MSRGVGGRAQRALRYLHHDEARKGDRLPGGRNDLGHGSLLPAELGESVRHLPGKTQTRRASSFVSLSVSYYLRWSCPDG